jgi:hypothetical protein
MKELRGKIEERQSRVLYAFDPIRTAVLLIGEDKTGDPSGTRNVCRLPMVCSMST